MEPDVHELLQTLDAPTLELGEWSLDRATLELIAAEIAAGRRRITECGSGAGTVAIARMLARCENGSLHSLEHDPAWAAEVRARLAAEGLAGLATVIEAPLAPDPHAEPGCRWYMRAALAALPSGIDLLVVDGPPAHPGEAVERSRYPALPVLREHLAAGAIVLLHDADRAGERWVAGRWQAELGIRLEHPHPRLARATLPPHAGATPRLRRTLGRYGARARAAVRERVRRVAQTDAIESRLDLAERRIVELYAGHGNHEQRIRRLAEVHAFSAWIERARLIREPLISVITPTHRRPAELMRAIASVAGQSYPNHEQIVVIDGPDAGVAATLETCAQPGVRCVTVEHGGPGAARNRGLAEARGELVAYLDDDNEMHPQWLKAVAWAFEQRPEAEVLYGGWVIDDPERLHGGPGGALPEFWITPFDRELQRKQALADMSAIAHRAGLADARFDPELAGYDDWDFLARLTARREPLVLPAIAATYSTRDPARRTARPDHPVPRRLITERLARTAKAAPASSAADRVPSRDDDQQRELQSARSARPCNDYGLSTGKTKRGIGDL